jgi:Holliday junction resolvasome RuvABC endonuclease subunit
VRPSPGTITKTICVTLLSVDPGTRSLGWAVFKDGKCVDNGVFHPGDWNAPSECLIRIVRFIAGKEREIGGIDYIACESMFVDARRGGNSARVLNCIPDEIEAWCEGKDISFRKYANSTVKRIATNNGNAKKPQVYAAMEKYLSPAARELTKSEREDVTDAIAIGWTCIVSKLGAAEPAPKKSRKKG